MMKLTARLTLSLLATLLLAPAARVTHAADRPMNLLIIQTDEHHFSTLSIYGATVIETPNIDWIGKNGAVATSFYATTPVCSPSRASLISGLYPHNTPVSNNNIKLRDNVVTYSKTLGDAGYATGFAGKWHLDGNGKPQWAPKRNFGFDDNRFMFNRGHWKKLEDGPDGPRVGARNQAGKPSYGVDGADEKTYTTDWLTDKTIDFIRQNKGRPFSFYVSIPDPHGPNTVRPPYDTLFDDIDVPIPASLHKTDAQTPKWALRAKNLSERRLRKLMKPYYGMVKCIDDNVGRILAELRNQDLIDNTIIVFTSDHGDLCGEHCRLNKGVPYEGSARIPFLIYYPGKIKPGTVVREALGTVDFTPTILSMMGVGSKVKYQGRDASALFTGEAKDWNDIAIVRSTSGKSPWIAAISDRYKLVLSKNGKPWLFDTHEDPDELTNLFGKPEHAKLTTRFAKHIRDYAKANSDPYGDEPAIKAALDSLIAPASPGDEEVASRRNPNIVVIYADDLGYGDVSCYNSERGKIATPHIDNLAAEGLRFTDAHSSSGVCSPSRYTLLTGRYHWRTRLQRGIVGVWGAPLIAPDRLTVAGMLKQHGYRTACVGKWHLGWDWPIESGQRPHFKNAPKNAEATDQHRATWRAVFSKSINGGPTTRGFDEYFGTDVPNWPPYCFIENDRTVGIPSEFLPARLFRKNQASRQGPALEGWTLEPTLPALGDRASSFIRRAAKEDKPYFLYMPLTSPHTPLAVNEAFKGTSGLGSYADLVIETDAIVGQVLEAIDESGEADNTLVVFTSDNGCAPYIGVPALEKKGHYPSGPLRGYKSDVWEGGHRVPLIVRWPGVVKPNSTCEQLVHQADLMATCAEIVEHTLADSAGEDSFSIVALLRGANLPVRKHAINQSSNGLLALRRGPWKLIFGQGSGGWTKGKDEHPAQLYNLDDDLGETVNLYGQHPKIVAELTQLMRQIVIDGRSSPGNKSKNDVVVKWDRFMPGTGDR